MHYPVNYKGRTYRVWHNGAVEVLSQRGDGTPCWRLLRRRSLIASAVRALPVNVMAQAESYVCAACGDKGYGSHCLRCGQHDVIRAA